MKFDSSNLWILGLAPVLFLGKTTNSERRPYLVLILWLFGGLLIDGLFGKTRWIARFQANFSTIGFFIMATSLTVVIFSDIIQLSLRKYFVKPPRRPLILIVCALAIWGVKFLPTIMFTPQSVFTTHSDIRVCRWVDQNIGQDILIANIRPPGETSSNFDGYGFMTRGNCVRSTIFDRVTDHHALHQKRTLDISACRKSDMITYLSCLKNHGITHVLFDARPQTKSYVAVVKKMVIFSEGSTYLLAL